MTEQIIIVSIPALFLFLSPLIVLWFTLRNERKRQLEAHKLQKQLAHFEEKNKIRHREYEAKRDVYSRFVSVWLDHRSWFFNPESFRIVSMALAQASLVASQQVRNAIYEFQKKYTPQSETIEKALTNDMSDAETKKEFKTIKSGMIEEAAGKDLEKRNIDIEKAAMVLVTAMLEDIDSYSDVKCI